MDVWVEWAGTLHVRVGMCGGGTKLYIPTTRYATSILPGLGSNRWSHRWHRLHSYMDPLPPQQGEGIPPHWHTASPYTHTHRGENILK